MERIAALLAVSLLAAACTGGEDATTDPSPSTPAVRLIARGLALNPGEAHAIKILFQPADPVAEFIATFTPAAARVSVCALDAREAPTKPADCEHDIRSGVRQPFAEPGLRGIAFLLDGPAAASLDLVIEFPEGDQRSIGIGLPTVVVTGGSGCEDNECNPLIEVEPVRGGAFSARATWDGPPATLALLQGRVLARARTASGIPYREPASSTGASPREIAAQLGEPGEYALVIRAPDQRSAAPVTLGSVRIDATWP